jgi:hypothetical protein
MKRTNSELKMFYNFYFCGLTLSALNISVKRFKYNFSLFFSKIFGKFWKKSEITRIFRELKAKLKKNVIRVSSVGLCHLFEA